MRVLIGGGSGFIGRHLHHLLEKNGCSVTIVSRGQGPGGITWADIRRNGLPVGCEAVINLAGENLLNPKKRWNSNLKSSLRSSRMDTTSQLASAISAANPRPKCWLSVSAVGYYPPSPTKIYNEESEGGRGDFLAELCADWEKSARLPASVSNDVRQVTVRIGVALGRSGGMIQQIYLPFFFGLGGRIGLGTQPFPWIHVEDVAGIMFHALQNNSVKGVLNAVAPQLSTNAEFAAAYGRALWRPAVLPLPSAAMNLVYGQERARAILEGQWVEPKRTLASGYKFLYPDLKSACDSCAKFMLPLQV